MENRTIINELGAHTPLHELEGIIALNDVVEEIKDLMETWETNNSLNELIEPTVNGPHGATHVYKENGLIIYLIVDETSITIVDAEGSFATAA